MKARALAACDVAPVPASDDAQQSAAEPPTAVHEAAPPVAPEPPVELPDAAIPAEPESPPRAATPAVEAEEAKLEARAVLPPVSEIAAPKPEAPAAKPAPSVPPAAPANDNIAAAAAKPLEDTGTEDRKAKRRREGAPGSAYSTRGSIQEEHVVRKRRDARND